MTLENTRYLYRTSSDTGEQPSIPTSPQVVLESHKVPLPNIYWHWRATLYLYLTSSDTGEPPSTSTSPVVILESY